MSLILSGTDGLSDVDGSAATPAIRGTDANTGIFFPAADTIGFSEGGAEVARFDASGNLGIGTSSPSTKLTVYDATSPQLTFNNGTSTFIVGNNVGGNNHILYGTGAYPLIFYTNATEGMRLDDSGNFLAGNTVASSATNAGFKFLKSAEGAGNDRTAIVFDSSSNSQIPFTLYSTGAGAYRFYVGAGGTIYATSIVITAISDERLKENVRDIDTGLNSIMALKPRRFDWKEGKGQDKKNVAGFIAQEFEDVFPESVGTSKAGGDGIEYKNINHETLIPTLVKAIQEQQTLITTLTARITALESA